MENENSVIVYDVAYLPDGLTIDEILSYVRKHKVWFYDSSKIADKRNTKYNKPFPYCITTEKEIIRKQDLS